MRPPRKTQTESQALEVLSKDIQTLENQKQIISRLMLEMLSGYESVLRRVRSSGDRTLATQTAKSLKDLGQVYRRLSAMRVLERGEEELLTHYTQGLHEAAHNLQYGQCKVGVLVKKLGRKQAELVRMHRMLASMQPLQVDEASFFDNPDRRTSTRRQRDVDRKLRR